LSLHYKLHKYIYNLIAWHSLWCDKQVSIQQTIMMNKSVLLVLVFIFLGQLMHGQKRIQALSLADQMPYFPGCDAFPVGSKDRRHCSNQTVKAYIFNHIIYPEEAKTAGIEGAVYVRFIIDEKGKVIHPQVLKDIGGSCGTAALKMLTEMPDWEPAIHLGKKVKVMLDLPIHFTLTEENPELEKTYLLTWGKLRDNKISKKQLRRHLNTPLTVFSPSGQSMSITELTFTYSKKNKLKKKSSNGRITPEMEKMVRKIRRGGRFSVLVTIQKDGEFIQVAREFNIHS